MRLKTYFSDSVQAAVRIAKIELGDQAVLLGSKQAPGGGDSSYEVTFGTVESPTEIETGPAAIPHWKRFIPRDLAVLAPEVTDTAEELYKDQEWQKLKAGVDDLCRIISAVDPATASRTSEDGEDLSRSRQQAVFQNQSIDSKRVPPPRPPSRRSGSPIQEE